MLLQPMLAAVLLSSGAAEPATARAVWEAWPARRFVTTAAACLRHAELVDRLRALESRHRGRLALEAVGRSVEGRAIHLLTLGRGPRRVLLWSQMHGDEPSATPALLDLAQTLLASDPGGVLDQLTLLMVPMLNPDGAERYVAAQRAGDRRQSRRARCSRHRRGGCSRRCATASTPSSASTCTTRTGAPPSATRACSPRSRCSPSPATPRGR